MNHGIEIKLPNMEEGLMSSRALVTTRNKYEEERCPDKILTANKIGTIQSFKT